MKRSKLYVLLAVLVVAFGFIFTACNNSEPADAKAEHKTEVTANESEETKNENTTVSENSTEEEETESNLNEEETKEAATKSENKKPEKEDVTKPSANGQTKLQTTEQIVSYFNQCANKVKTNATKVVKNFEKRSVTNLKVPDALQNMAEGILKSTFKDDTDPIVYDTKEEIRNEFIVPAQSYVSVLKASDVEKAECRDNGKEYEIYFKLKDEKNPVSGKGVGAVCDVIEAHDVAKKAPSFVKELSTYYSDCEVRATIDKTTGRMVHAVYSTPVKLNVIVDLFGTHHITADFKYVKDYSVTY